MSGLVESFSGIRGVYGQSLTQELAERYAAAFVCWLQSKQGNSAPKVIVGRDTRASSKELANAFVAVFVAAGCEVVEVGVCSTPATEHAVRHFGCAGGVMITGSHNPPEHNGWKFLRADGAILSANDAELVIRYAREKKSPPQSAGGTIRNAEREAVDAYLDFIAAVVGEEGMRAIQSKGFNLVFDCGGGAIIPIIKSAVLRFGIGGVLVNDTPGIFNRQIEPTPESLLGIVPKLQAAGADFAIGFDCDADRAEIVLPDGTMVSGQHLLALAVESVLSEHPDPASQVVVVTDATSDLVAEVAHRHGARIQEVEVGEVNVVDAMQKLGSAVGGEGSSSGGIIAPQTCRDGLLAFLIIVRHLANTGQSIASLLQTYPRFYTVNRKADILEFSNIRNFLKNYFAHITGAQITTTGGETGGFKIRFQDGAWLWFRQSKTEAGCMRVYAESKNELRAYELLERGATALVYSNMLSAARPYLAQGRADDYAHTEFLLGICREILEQEGLDESIMIPAIIFHDIGWGLLDESIKTNFHSAEARRAHMERGAELARTLLEELGYPKEKTARIAHLVSVHDNQSAGIGGTLHDADELALAGIDFLWRASPVGFKKGMLERGEDASSHAAYVRVRAQSRLLSPAIAAVFERLLVEQGF